MKRGISLYHICVRPRRYGLWLSNNAQLDLMDGEEENVLCHYSNLAFLRLTQSLACITHRYYSPEDKVLRYYSRDAM